MTVILAIGPQRNRTHGLEHLGEIALRVKLEDVLRHSGVGRVGAEVDIVAKGHRHAEVDGALGCIDHLELARLAIVADDVRALVGVVAGNVTIGHSINHCPECVERDAGCGKLRAIHVDQRTGDVAGGGNVNLVAAHGQTPCVAVLTVAAGNQAIDLALAGERI